MSSLPNAYAGAAKFVAPSPPPAPESALPYFAPAAAPPVVSPRPAPGGALTAPSGSARGSRTFFGNDILTLAIDAPPGHIVFPGEVVRGVVSFRATSGDVRVSWCDVKVENSYSIKAKLVTSSTSGRTTTTTTHTYTSGSEWRETTLPIAAASGAAVGKGATVQWPFEVAVPDEALPCFQHTSWSPDIEGAVFTRVVARIDLAGLSPAVEVHAVLRVGSPPSLREAMCVAGQLRQPSATWTAPASKQITGRNLTAGPCCFGAVVDLGAAAAVPTAVLLAPTERAPGLPL